MLSLVLVLFGLGIVKAFHLGQELLTHVLNQLERLFDVILTIKVAKKNKVNMIHVK